MRLRFRFYFSALVFIVCPTSIGAQTPLYLFGETADSLEVWDRHSFEGETDYSLQRSKEKGFPYILARSEASASGLIRELEVDLEKTPVLNWKWRLDRRLAPLPETSKEGDDYAARLYVIVSGGWLFWRTKALNFVWSSREVKGAQWPNAFAPDNALMLALKDATDPTGQWFQESINVRALLSEWLGEGVSTIHAVALMSDTDNSGRSASAAFADIHFTAQ